MLEQYDDMLALYGRHTGVNLARKHIGWYTKGLPGSAELRNRVNQQDDPAIVVRMLQRLLFALAPALGGLKRNYRDTSVFFMQRPVLGPGGMDARTAESPVISQQQSWLQRERASGRFYDRMAALIGLFLLAMLGLSFWLLRRGAEPGTICFPRQLIALLLIRTCSPPSLSWRSMRARWRCGVRSREGSAADAFTSDLSLVYGHSSRSNGAGRNLRFSIVPERPRVLVLEPARNMLENTVQDRAGQSTDGGGTGRRRDGASQQGHRRLSPTMPIDDPRFAAAFADSGLSTAASRKRSFSPTERTNKCGRSLL